MFVFLSVFDYLALSVQICLKPCLVVLAHFLFDELKAFLSFFLLEEMKLLEM